MDKSNFEIGSRNRPGVYKKWAGNLIGEKENPAKCVSTIYDNWSWGVQCDRYGADHMILWHDNLRLKVKERIYR